MRTPNNERLTPDIADLPSARKASGPAQTRPDKSSPERRCILTGEHAPRDVLVRLAISPDGDVLPDPAAKAPGRGAWIGVSRQVLENALAKGQLKGALARAYKGASLSIPEDLPQRVEAALRRHFTDRLGLEMRSGNLVLGSDRIAEQARIGRIAMLLHAADSSEDGRKKLDQAWRVGRDAEGSGERGLLLPLDRTALSVALGRENVVHLGVGGRDAGASAAARVELALSRLKHFLGVANPCETIDAGHVSRLDDQARPAPDTNELNA